MPYFTLGSKKQAQKNGLYFLQTVHFFIYNYLIFTNRIFLIILSPDNLEHYPLLNVSSSTITQLILSILFPLSVQWLITPS